MTIEIEEDLMFNVLQILTVIFFILTVYSIEHNCDLWKDYDFRRLHTFSVFCMDLCVISMWYMLTNYEFIDLICVDSLVHV